MPTYEYECLKCGRQFELFQGIKDPPRKLCPRCRGRVRRMLGTGAAVLFKGSGFYATDYRSEGYRKAARAETSAPPPGNTEGKSSSADKPAGKTSAGKTST